MEETQQPGIIRDEQGRFPPGVSGNPEGRKPDTPEVKMVKKAIKEIVSEYKENLANALPLIEPVLIAKAIAGDMTAVKEIHDRVMDKARQPNDVDIKGILEIKFAQDFRKDVDTPPGTVESYKVESTVQDNSSRETLG